VKTNFVGVVNGALNADVNIVIDSNIVMMVTNVRMLDAMSVMRMNNEIKLIREKSKKKIHPALDIDSYGNCCICQYLLTNNSGEEKESPLMIFSNKSWYPVKDEDPDIKYIPSKLVDGGWKSEHIYEFLDGKNQEVSFKSVFDRIKKEYEYYMDFSDDRMYDFCALWVIGSYFHPFFNSYPYVFWNATKSSGKTKVLTLTEMMAFNAINATSITASSLFRLIQGNRCTILMDEAEKGPNERERTDIRSMLLSGYKRAGKVYRAEEGRRKGTKYYKVSQYEIYGPKMMANIAGVEDVLESRCIYFSLQRTMNVEKGNREINEQDLKWWDIRNELYLLLMSSYNNVLDIYCNLNIPDSLNELSVDSEDTVTITYPKTTLYVTPLVPSQHTQTTQNTTISKSIYRLLSNRDMELWKSILCLAKMIDETLYLEMLNFAIEKSKEKKIDELSDIWDLNVLYALLELAETDGYIFTKDILAKCKELDESMEKTTTQWIGRTIKKFGFTDKKREGRGIKIGIVRDKLLEVCNRYGVEVKEAEKTDEEPKSEGESAKPEEFSGT
jgi:hypothetical protein